MKQFNKASELLNKGEFLEARQLLEQLRKSHPNNGKILFYLAQTNFKLQDYHSAFEYYRLCSQLSGIEDWILAWSRIRMGKILASSGKYIEAKKLFNLNSVAAGRRGCRPARRRRRAGWRARSTPPTGTAPNGAPGLG